MNSCRRDTLFRPKRIFIAFGFWSISLDSIEFLLFASKQIIKIDESYVLARIEYEFASTAYYLLHGRYFESALCQIYHTTYYFCRCTG